MPMDNSLNVSELLKRLGVVGDSKASAPILDELRLTVSLADLSDLVPPLGVAIGGGSIPVTSGVGTFNKWTLHSRSAGGLRVNFVGNEVNADAYRFWVTDADPFVGSVVTAHANFSFENPAISEFMAAPAAASVSPLGSFIARGAIMSAPFQLGNWIGPGQFFNVEAQQANQAAEVVSIMWREYPAALNP